MRPYFLVLLLLVGCVHSSHILTGTPREPISADQVRIYAADPAKYEEIAILEASSKNSGAFTNQGKTDAMIERLKEEAAALGANGILIHGYGDSTTGTIGTSFSASPRFRLGSSAAVVHKTGQARAIYVFKE